MRVAQTGLDGAWCALRMMDETWCGLRYGAGFRWVFGDGLPTCPQCKRAMPPQENDLSEVALAAQSLCAALNQWCNDSDLPAEVVQAQAVLEELLNQYAGGLTPHAADRATRGG